MSFMTSAGISPADHTLCIPGLCGSEMGSRMSLGKDSSWTAVKFTARKTQV